MKKKILLYGLLSIFLITVLMFIVFTKEKPVGLATGTTTTSLTIPEVTADVKDISKDYPNVGKFDKENSAILNWPEGVKPTNFKEYAKKFPYLVKTLNKKKFYELYPKRKPRKYPPYKSGRIQTVPLVVVFVDNSTRSRNILRQGAINTDASSWFNENYGHWLVNDGVVAQDNGEWAANGERERELQEVAAIENRQHYPYLTISSINGTDNQPIRFGVTSIVVKDRPNPTDNILRLKTIFADGTFIETDNHNRNQDINIPVNPRKITSSLRFEILEWEGPNPGIAEVEVYDNIRIAPRIDANIRQLTNNLVNEGYEVSVIPWDNGSPEDMKNLLKGIYQNPNAAIPSLPNLPAGLFYNFAGIILIGDLPVPWMEYNDSCLEYHQFPCDLFFMDLDGQWEDTDGNGIYDKHFDGPWDDTDGDGIGDSPVHGNGTIDPEIWCGRIYASTVSFGKEQEISLINDYLERNHRFRNGQILVNKALVYYDDDFKDFVSPYMAYFYNPNRIDRIDDFMATNADDFKTRIFETPVRQRNGAIVMPPGPYDWIDIIIHGLPFSIELSKRFTDNEEITSGEFRDNRILPYFSIFRSCGPGRFVEQTDYSYSVLRSDRSGYLAGHLIFGNTNGLVSISAADAHFLFPFDTFYKGLDNGRKCIGDAFKDLCRDTFSNPLLDLRGLKDERAEDNPPIVYIHPYVILGDPTLRPFNHLDAINKGNVNMFVDYINRLIYKYNKPEVVPIGFRYEKVAAGYRVGFSWRYYDRFSLNRVFNKNRLYGGNVWSRFDVRDLVPQDIRLRAGRRMRDLKYMISINRQASQVEELVIENRGLGTINFSVLTDVVVQEGDTVRVVLDTNNVVDENNEINNAKEAVVPALSGNDVDLAPVDLYFRPDAYSGIIEKFTLEQGYQFSDKSLCVEIANRGREARPADNYRMIIIAEAEGKEGTAGAGGISFIGTNQSVSLGLKCLLTNLHINEDPPRGLYTFHVTVDDEDEIPESDEGNNEIARELMFPY